MQALTSLDLHFLLKELNLENSKIDKVFQKEKDFSFQIHVPGHGKKYLRVILPSMMFLADAKEEQEDTGKFALSLRKHISGERIRKVEQREFERIIDFTLDSKRLYIELFSPGNIILCDEAGKIIMAYTYKGFGSRMIRPNATYEYPKRKYNFLEITVDDLTELVAGSNKGSVVIMLATELGLGGLYAEEILLRSGIDRTKSRLEKNEIISLFNAICTVKNESVSPHMSGGIVTPFHLKSKESKKLDTTMCMELEKVFLESPKEDKHSKEKEKLLSILRSQEDRIVELGESAETNQKIGERIYENYELVDSLIKGIKDAKKRFSLHDMKEKLGGHPHVKKITERKISIEL